MSTTEYFKQYYINNKEKLKQRAKDNYHRTKSPEKNRERYLKHREESLRRAKRWRDNNKKLKSERDREYRRKNKARLRKWYREYRKKNKDRINNYLRNKRRTDVNFRIKHNLRKRVGDVLKGISKSKHTMELLGCSYDFFHSHIEKQFTEGMSWENYGYRGWHIDHKIPCDKFDLTNSTEQEKCFHYLNLQPMWGVDNMIKGNRY